MEDADKKLPASLKAQVALVTKAAIVDIMKSVATIHSKSLIQEAFRRAACRLLTTMFIYDGGCKIFESAIIRLATSYQMVQAIVKIAVKEKKLVVAMARLLVSQAKKDVRLRVSWN